MGFGVNSSSWLEMFAGESGDWELRPTRPRPTERLKAGPADCLTALHVLLAVLPACLPVCVCVGKKVSPPPKCQTPWLWDRVSVRCSRKMKRIIGTNLCMFAIIHAQTPCRHR